MQVSVVIACYNAADTLAVQLEALCRQSLIGGFEVLLCDNGSTDASTAVAESFRGRLPGLRIIDASARRGPAHARNVGAWAASSPLLAFCDADDEVADDWLEQLVGALAEHAFVAGRFESRKLNRGAVLRSRELQQDDELQVSPFGPALAHAGAGNLGVRRDVFIRVGGFDAAIGCLEDTDLSWRIQLAGVPLVFRPDAVVHVRLRSRLRGMWKQGRAYGTASAMLADRFAGLGPEQAPADDAAPKPSLPARLGRLVREQRSLGGVLWQLGWHMGHRSWRPEYATAPPVPLGGPGEVRRAS